MESLIGGVVLIVIGGLVATYGVRVFYFLLPVWGFVSGFVLGAQLIAALLGEGFLATAAGWGVGLVLGVVFAVIAGVWFWAAIVILAGGVGWVLGTGLVAALGITDGFLPLIAGAVLAAALAILAIVIDAPTVLVAVLTSFGGSAYPVAGALLVVRRITIADLEYGALDALAGHPVALVAWAALGLATLMIQVLDARARSLDLRARPDRATAA
jgi:hypothetical protein